MKTLKFRVKNFRSIIDSGEVDFSSDVTVLAGKNEAGKTVLLKALEKFNGDSVFDSDDLPIGSGTGTQPEVIVTFRLDKNDFADLTGEIKLPVGLSRDAIIRTPFEVTKQFKGNYQFGGKDGSIVDLLLRSKLKRRKQIVEKLDSGYQQVKAAFLTFKVSSYPLSDVGKLDPSQLERLRTEFLPQVDSAITQLPADQHELLGEFKEELVGALASCDQLLAEWRTNRDKLLESIPNFVYFEAFDKQDALPFEIDLESAKTHKSVQRYCVLSGLDLPTLSDPNTTLQNKLALTKNVSAFIEGDFKECWKQDKIDLRVELYGDNKLIFAFYEQGKNHPFKMEQRSKGLQWFLAFYLLVKAEVRRYASIILIDEPGLFVHAQAQNDILDVLTELAKENQVLLTTHSPYLIDPSRLDRIRLVIKDLDRKNKGTRVFPLTSDAAADRVTLMPVITAIGLDITKQLTIAADHNLIVEGISDYYYLQAALRLIPASLSKKFESVHFIPLTGADNAPSLVSLLIGWKLEFHVLLDRDDKGKEIARTLSEKLLIDRDQISFVSDVENHEIEDLISKDDFNKHVLGRPEDYKRSELNSATIPSANKAAFAKTFFERVNGGQISLSKETQANFTNLFTALSQKKV